MRNILKSIVVSTLAISAAFGADAAAGKAPYDQACKKCHGADGTANPSMAKMMKVELKDLKAPEVQSMGDAAMKTLITDGKGKMKPIKTVTGADLDNVVGYVKTLKK